MLTIRTYTIATTDGTELGTYTQLNELGNDFVAHFGKGYRGLADKLIDALKVGKDTERMESILGIRVKRGFTC